MFEVFQGYKLLSKSLRRWKRKAEVLNYSLCGHMQNVVQVQTQGIFPPTPAWLRDLIHHTTRVCFTNSKRTVLSKHWCLLKPMQMDEEVGYEYHRINYCKACTCSQHWVMIRLQPEPIEKLVSEKYNKDNYNETDVTGVGWRHTVGVDMLVLFHQGIWHLHP
jgi:hypothetical protein